MLELPSLQAPPRSGRITVTCEQTLSIQRRLLGLPASRLRVAIDRRFRRGPADCCYLDYRATRHKPGYLTLDYIRTGPQTSFKTFRRAVCALDVIAARLQSVAIFTEVCNPELSPRLLKRWGWEPLHNKTRHQLWVKRLYSAESSSPPRTS